MNKRENLKKVPFFLAVRDWYKELCEGEEYDDEELKSKLKNVWVNIMACISEICKVEYVSDDNVDACEYVKQTLESITDPDVLSFINGLKFDNHMSVMGTFQRYGLTEEDWKLFEQPPTETVRQKLIDLRKKVTEKSLNMAIYTIPEEGYISESSDDSDSDYSPTRIGTNGYENSNEETTSDDSSTSDSDDDYSSQKLNPEQQALLRKNRHKSYMYTPPLPPNKMSESKIKYLQQLQTEREKKVGHKNQRRVLAQASSILILLALLASLATTSPVHHLT